MVGKQSVEALKDSLRVTEDAILLLKLVWDGPNDITTKDLSLKVKEGRKEEEEKKEKLNEE